MTDSDESMAVRLMAVLMHHKFEQQVSDHCRGNNMDRVALTIDHGDGMVEFEGVKEPVFYLIFEIADGDIRNHIIQDRSWQPQRKFRLLHQVAVGISQLHSAKVSHNDVKPPNILVFADEHKVADLGQATSDSQSAPHDWEAVVGDPRYAPPEVLYMNDGEPGTRLVPNRVRQAGDLYLFGSLVYYMFTGRMMTPAVLDGLNFAHKPACGGSGWTGSFEDVIPYWRNAFANELAELRGSLSADGVKSDLLEQVVSAVSQLCEPEIERRGHPNDVIGGTRTFAVHRYVTLFDRLSQKHLH